MKRVIGIGLAFLVGVAAHAGEKPRELTSGFLDAIREVESGGDCNAIGDGGRAIGPYQIHYVYWLDAVEAEPSLRARGYQACKEEGYARAVVVAYLTRYGANQNAEGLARIHNGGPKGYKKAATRGYWSKVSKAMGGA